MQNIKDLALKQVLGWFLDHAMNSTEHAAINSSGFYGDAVATLGFEFQSYSPILKVISKSCGIPF